MVSMCGYRLRTKPRNIKYKAKLHENKKVVEIQELLLKEHQQQRVGAIS